MVVVVGGVSKHIPPCQAPQSIMNGSAPLAPSPGAPQALYQRASRRSYRRPDSHAPPAT